MATNEVEMKLRSFLTNELMNEQAEFLSLEDELELDSLDQTELRVFLSQEFKIPTEVDQVAPDSLRTLKGIIGLVPTS